MRLAKLQLYVQLATLVVFLGLTWPTLTVWKDSIPWLQFLSIFAIVEGAAGGVAAAWANLVACRVEEQTD